MHIVALYIVNWCNTTVAQLVSNIHKQTAVHQAQHWQETSMRLFSSTTTKNVSEKFHLNNNICFNYRIFLIDVTYTFNRCYDAEKKAIFKN